MSMVPDDKWPREMRKRVSEVTGSSKVVSDENGNDLGSVERIPESGALVSAVQTIGRSVHLPPWIQSPSVRPTGIS